MKDAKATKQLVALLSAPLEKYKDVVTILKLSNYGKVMEHLDYDTNRVMAVVLIQSILANNTLITAPEKVLLCVDAAFLYVSSLRVVGQECQKLDLLICVSSSYLCFFLL